MVASTKVPTPVFVMVLPMFCVYSILNSTAVNDQTIGVLLRLENTIVADGVYISDMLAHGQVRDYSLALVGQVEWRRRYLNTPMTAKLIDEALAHSWCNAVDMDGDVVSNLLAQMTGHAIANNAEAYRLVNSVHPEMVDRHWTHRLHPLMCLC